MDEMRIIGKRLLFTMCVCFVGIFMVSCKGRNIAGPGTTVTPSGTNPSAAPTVNVEPWENASHSIRWVLKIGSEIQEEDQKKINRTLYDKGIDCRVEFMSIPGLYTGQEYAEWIHQSAEADIITVNMWYDSQQSFSFSRENLLKLNDYLNSEEGSCLKNAFAEIEWERVTCEKEIYSVPKRNTISDYGVSLSYNSKYEDYFEAFDGTYVSLKEIYKQIGNENLKIVIDSLSIQEIDALLGYDSIYLSSVPYDKETKQAVSSALIIDEEAKICDCIYQDLKDGIFTVQQSDSFQKDDVLAYIYMGKQIEREGYETIVLSKDYYEPNNMGCYGIYCNSQQSQLALQVLTECFKDAEIASVLNWGSADSEKWNQITELMKAENCNELNGFLPELTSKEKSDIEAYENNRKAVLGKLFRYDDSGNRMLNATYKAAGTLSDSVIFNNAVEAINRELNLWFSGFPNE